MRMAILLPALLAVALASLAVPALAHPHPITVTAGPHAHEASSEIIPLDAQMGVERTTLLFHAPEDNALPWGFVEGKITNHVASYPVVIQMFMDGQPAHFGQAPVGEDGTYEYKFRVASMDGGQMTRAFVGDYTVIIHKIIYLEQPGTA